MARAGWLALLAVLVLGAGATAADAAVRAIPLAPAQLRGDPVLADDGGVLWLAERDRVVTVMRADPDGAPRPVATLPPILAPYDVPPDVVDYVLSASSTTIAVTRHAETCADADYCKYQTYETRISDVVLASVDGAATVISGCGYSAGEPLCPGRDCVTASVARVVADLVVTDDHCAPRGASGAPPADVVVRRPPDPQPLLRIAAAGAPVSVAAGALLTYVGAPSGSGGVLTAWPLAGGDPLRQLAVQRLDGAAIAADGTIAYGQGESDGHLWVAAPGSAPRDLGAIGAYGSVAAIAMGRVLLSGHDTVTVRGLDGTRIGPIAVGDPAKTAFVPAFDGTRIAYAARPCQADTVVVQDVTDRTPAFVRGGCVSPVVSGPMRLPRRAGAGTVTVRCRPDPERGCQGEVRVILQRRRLGPGATGQLALPLATYDVAPAASATLTFPVSARVARLARRQHLTRALVTTTPNRYADDRRTGPPRGQRVPLAFAPAR